MALILQMIHLCLFAPKKETFLRNYSQIRGVRGGRQFLKKTFFGGASIKCILSMSESTLLGPVAPNNARMRNRTEYAAEMHTNCMAVVTFALFELCQCCKVSLPLSR